MYKISFSDGEMPAADHNPEFHFSILNCIMSLKQIMFEFTYLSAVRGMSNSITVVHVLGIAQIMP